MNSQQPDTSVTDVEFREVAVQDAGSDNPLVPAQEQAAADKPVSGGVTLPAGFDYSPQSISKLAMVPNELHGDLIGACRKVLETAGVPADRLALLDSHVLINQARGKSLLAQRSALNSFWHLQFAPLGTEAYGARQLLVNEGDQHNWIKWFSGIPLDVILKHELPSPFKVGE